MSMDSKYPFNNKLVIGILLIVIIQTHVSGQDSTISLKLRDSVNINCKFIQSGQFLMGSPDSDPLAGATEKPQRVVQITKGFYMGLTPITIKQFQVFVDETGYKTIAETDGIGGHGYSEEKKKFEGLFPQYTWKHTGWTQSSDHPVVNVSWTDAGKFCEWLSAKTGKKIRLPTEQEWEYACRASTNTIFFTGDDPNSLKGYANVADDALRGKLNEQSTDANRAFPFDDGSVFTAPVGRFKPNPWGLYDMTGNVYQIVDAVFAPDEPSRKYNNVAKGGAYNSSPEFLRSAFRGSINPSSKYSYIGFRIVIVQ